MALQGKLTTDVKKQHTVPRFLLNNFGFGKTNKKKKLFTYDKYSGRQYLQSIFDATTRNSFYNLENHPDRVSLEPLLGVYESDAAPVFKKILNSKSLSGITEDEKRKLSVFLLVQRARSYNELQSLTEAVEKVADRLRNLGMPEKTLEKEIGTPDSGDRKNFFLTSLVEQIEFLPHIMDKKLVLYQTNKSNPFYISDNPVTLHNHIDMGDWCNIGYALKGIQIHLPISSTFTLAFVCPTVAEQIIHKKNELEYLQSIDRTAYLRLTNASGLLNFAEAFESGVPMKSKADNVRFLNSLQVKSSEQYVYCGKNDFGLVKEMISKNPRYKTGPRIHVN